MKQRATLIIICSVMSISHLWAQAFTSDEPLAHTFSIVGRDNRTGEMAVAVQSHWFSVGTVVSWGKPAVGVVATQSFVNKSFGIRGLQLMEEGKSPEEALQILLEGDPGKEVRQVALLDHTGRVAVHTGANCIAYAGHAKGDGFSVQANMMLNDRVVPAMEKAWTKFQDLPIAERMVEVLIAAQEAGGDIRGKQSAALLVVGGEKSERPWDDRLIDLRVDDATDPIAELRRLLSVHRAYEFMNEGDLHVEHHDMEKAMTAYRKAMSMFPDNLEMQYWTAISLASEGEVAKAAKMLSSIYQKDPHWRELTRRLPRAGVLNVTDQQLSELTR